MLEGITKGLGETLLAAILNSASVRAPGTRGSPIAIPSEVGHLVKKLTLLQSMSHAKQRGLIRIVMCLALVV